MSGNVFENINNNPDAVKSDVEYESDFFNDEYEDKNEYNKYGREWLGEDESYLIAKRYECFDPAEELKKINNFTKEEREELSYEKYLTEKSRRIAEYKKRFIKQVVGVSQLNCYLEDILLQENDQLKFSEKVETLREYIIEYSADLRLSPVQIQRYGIFLRHLCDRNEIMDSIQGTLIFGEDDEELFLKLFNGKPDGKVHINRGLAAFLVECEDIGDYARAYNASTEVAERSEGFARGLAIGINNRGGHLSDDQKKIIRTHEERHTLKSLLDETVETVMANFPKSLQNFCVEVNIINIGFVADKRIRDEIFAYLKDETPIDIINAYLLESHSEDGLYDYFAEYMEPFINRRGSENEKTLVLMNKERKLHQKRISDGLALIEKMENLSMSRKQIISLLEFDLLRDWKKKIIRLEDEGFFLELRKEVLERYTKILNLAEREQHVQGMVTESKNKKRALLGSSRNTIASQIDYDRIAQAGEQVEIIKLKKFIQGISRPFQQ